MERLETSLDDLLEHMPNLPLSLKRSVLEDVASGLLYLHERPSPVIHRDLTAKNVLLTSSLVAKITDMGNSRIIDMRPGQMARTLSKLPGTLAYMPPEALDDGHCYGPALDIFSFGHLALFTLIQVSRPVM
jgi:serine/threonine protein kinase